MKKRVKCAQTKVFEASAEAGPLTQDPAIKLLKLSDLYVSGAETLKLARGLQYSISAMDSANFGRTPESPPSILVVDSHAAELAKTVAVLRSAGYHVVPVLGFDEARKTLDRIEPTVLVTSVRLGSYNGLHLVVRSRVSRPGMSAILLHDVLDSVLETEARKQGAAFLVAPWRRQTLLGLVRSSVERALKAGVAKPGSLISIAES